MSSNRRAGALNHRIEFLQKTTTTNAIGGRGDAFVAQFSRRAAFRHKSGGEAVIAARLEGRHVMVVTIRRCAQSSQIDASWRVRDQRENVVFDIKDITTSEDGGWLEILCESIGQPGG